MSTSSTRDYSGPRAARRARPIRTDDVLVNGLLLTGSVFTLFPFVWMMLSAFKQPQEVTAFPPVWIPSHPTLDTLGRVWAQIDFARYFANTLFVSTVTTLTVLFTSSLVGFVFAKYDFPLKNAAFVAILATMMIPWPVTIIPAYQLMVWLGFINTYWALIVPGLYSPFGIFLMRQFMFSLPNELFDAARMDGASELRIFTQIVLALIKPALSALGIFQFLGHWNDFVWPLIVLSNEKLFTLSVALARFREEEVVDMPAVMSGAAISIVPVLVVFLVLQRQFIAGIAFSGMKG